MSAAAIGAHVGRLAEIDLAEAATRIGADCVQVFLGDPQDWKADPLAGIDDAAVRASLAKLGLRLYVHAPYVINVASPDNRIRIPSRNLLQRTVTAAGQVGAAGVVVHGGHVPAGADPAAGVANWGKAVQRLEPGAPLLIENTAGGEGAMARSLDQLGRLWDIVGGHDVGLCLDTCHAFAAGHRLDTVVAEVRAVTGRIDLVHANDSRDPFGSGRDRHADLGTGTIGARAVAQVVREAGCPAVLETPGAKAGADGEGGVTAEIAWLRAWLSDPDAAGTGPAPRPEG